MVPKKKLFLLDAYALIYRSYFAFIKNPRVNSKGLNTSAIFGFTTTLEQILNNEQPSHIGVAFDPRGGTFRNQLYSEYKANREETPEDIRLSVPYIKQILEAFNIPVLEVAGYEADDVIGTLSHKAEAAGFDVYMMTPDKDYAQLVSEHVFMYKPKRFSSENEVWGISEVCNKFGIKDPKQVIDILGLWGDSADNIPGAPGVGEKTAAKLIDQFGSIEGVLENTDQLKGKQREKIEENVEQIKLSKILATIALDVPIAFDEAALKRTQINRAKLKPLFDELEFRTIAQRILQAKPEVASSGALQGSLFGDDEAMISMSSYDNIESISHTYHLIDTIDKCKELFLTLSEQTAFCFDTETTGINANEAELIGISFSFKAHVAYYVPIPDLPENYQPILELFKPLFENQRILKIGQNIKYDILMLKWYGIEIRGELFDTMLAHYLLQPDLKHNMDFLSQTYLNYNPVSIETLIGTKGKQQRSMRDVYKEDPIKVKDYAAEDADITWQLYKELKKELKKYNLENLAQEIEFPLIPVLAEMEKTGVNLNVAALSEFAKELSELIISTEKEILDMAEIDFNVGSPKQLGEVLFVKMKLDEKARKTKSGQYSTNEETLVKLKDKHPIIEKILDFRGYKKLLSTYVDALPKLINQKTGRIHTSYNQAIAATGRLSSVNPNLQNIPIREEQGRQIRKAFIPTEDEYIIFSADYSQIELRLMAHLSQDPNLMEAFNNKEDVHAATAAKINKIPLEEVSREMRSQAKTANFGIIYGISAFGLSQRLNISRSEGKALIDGYFESYPKVKEYMDYSIRIAREKGFVSTLMGRKRQLNDINSRNAVVRGMAERNAINAPIQGSAADIIKIAMIRIHERFEEEKFKSRMILQVHDELNFNVFKPELDQVKEIVIEEMQNAVRLKVPLIVDHGEGANWLEAH
jgi:DNA polymerase I